MGKDMRTGLILSEIALVILLLANTIQLWKGHGDLIQLVASQKGNDAQIAKVDQQLDALATGTRRLAEGGNQNAARILQVLAQNGISIKPKGNPPS